MFRGRVAWTLILAALFTATVALAEDPVPPPAATSAQVEKLQAQLGQLSTELGKLKQAVASADLPAQQRQMMMGHMGQMEGYMHGMMSDCCMMDPATCPAHMGMSPKPR